MKTYLVGGAVRDKIMGKDSNDLDYTVVLESTDLVAPGLTVTPQDPFEIMVRILKDQGFTIFLESPQFLTARARFPRGHKDERQTADFVLARKESGYSDGRRPDKVEAGDLLADLSRRDFSINAIALDEAGNFIDPFNGRQDINDGVIRAVGDAFDRFTEDALRAVRALRFAVTLDFRIDHEVRFAMESAAVLDAIKNNIADERIKDELNKMFKVNPIRSIELMNRYWLLTNAMFNGRVNLEATMKQKGYSG